MGKAEIVMDWYVMEDHSSASIRSHLLLLPCVNLQKPEIYPNLYSPNFTLLQGSAFPFSNSLCLQSTNLPSFTTDLTIL